MTTIDDRRQFLTAGAARKPGTIATAADHGRGNVIRLAIAQALAGANSTVIYATGAILGNTLAPDRALATLPVSILVVGMAASTLPAGAIARRYGRRAAFLAGTGCGVITGLLSAAAVFLGSFWLFCAATFFGGVYQAVVLSFRFAVADGVRPELRPRAMSAVMAGGVFAGVLGPQLVTFTMDLWQPYLFAATFLAQAGVALLSAFILWGVHLPRPATAAETAAGHPLGEIAPAPVHRGGRVWGRLLHADDPADDLRAACDEVLRAVAGGRQSRSSMACDRDVWAELLHRPADRSLRLRAPRIVTAGLLLERFAVEFGKRLAFR